MIKWLVYTIIFGFAVGADNVAHVTGFAIGAAIGYYVRPRWLKSKPTRWLRRTATTLGAIAACGTIYLTLAPPPFEQDQKHPTQMLDGEPLKDKLRNALKPLKSACAARARGNIKEAMQQFSQYGGIAENNLDTLTALCADLQRRREECQSGIVTNRDSEVAKMPADIQAQVVRHLLQQCDILNE